MTRILVVDDDKDHLSLFRLILEDQGYSVDAFHDPVTALLKFRANYYDLAMLDYLMPHLNGLELYRRIKDVDSTTKCCIITATQEQLADDEHVPQGQKKLRMIRKPIGNEELLTEINSLLGQDSIT